MYKRQAYILQHDRNQRQCNQGYSKQGVDFACAVKLIVHQLGNMLSMRPEAQHVTHFLPQTADSRGLDHIFRYRLSIPSRRFPAHEVPP